MPSKKPEDANAPLHLVLGTDEFLADRAAGNVVAAARKKVGASSADEFVVTTRASSEVTPMEIGELLAPSLFG